MLPQFIVKISDFKNGCPVGPQEQRRPVLGEPLIQLRVGRTFYIQIVPAEFIPGTAVVHDGGIPKPRHRLCAQGRGSDNQVAAAAIVPTPSSRTVTTQHRQGHDEVRQKTKPVCGIVKTLRCDAGA